MEQKAVIRKKMKASLNSMKMDVFHELSHQITNNLIETDEWKKAKVIGTTISMGKELDTSYLIQKAWWAKKLVAIPRCLPKTKGMDFRIFTNDKQLEVINYGLREPIIELTASVTPNQIDLLIVPGLIYDLRGYRIGFGGGYYDRYLANYPNKTISLAFDIQVMEHIPNDRYDLPVQKIITEKRVINTNVY